ncbi:MAG TPA: hydrogenase maturation nickel metallochaperone HypA [Bryobacteraceae bacterium]|nr:hydrogenase maturation nickel metallochaperone HypA [Bryobacteraceae bacterium]
MHELSIALSIIEGAQEEAERHGGGRVSAVHVKVGPLSGVVRDSLLFAYDLACEGTPLNGSRLLVEETPVTIHCPACGMERAAVSVEQLCCSVCGKPSAEVMQGRELEVVALELE